MKNVYINEAETIFETFYDTGDTYSDHQKYNCMEKYELCGDGKYLIGWNGVYIHTTGIYTISRNIELDVSDFDTLNLKMKLPEGMTVKVRVEIDGKLIEIISSDEREGEFEGGFLGEKMTRIEIEFSKTGDLKTYAILWWLGLVNSQRREEMLKRENGFKYPDCWEGCFKEDFEIKPHLSAFFDESELEKIRQKVKTEEFKPVFEELEKRAEKALSIEPEKYIGEYVQTTELFLGRRRNKEAMPRTEMEDLAFVGLVNKNKVMLRHACRIALSVSCCDKWTEGVIGAFPGATWHHRAFLEGDLSCRCSKVLDWAGEALTWHGRNIIYNAIIMKGLPRLEADIYTMDYIWYMNQGIVFSAFLITTLLALAKRYPRYMSIVDKHEAWMCEMWENYVNEDGGCGEGPAYWNYSALFFMKTLYYIARNKNVELSEYIPESLKKAEFYAKGVLSTVKDGQYHVPINDTHYDKGFDLIVPAFFANAGTDKKYWSYILKKSVTDVGKLAVLVDFLILTNNVQECKDIQKPLKEGYIPLINTGTVTLARVDKEIGQTAVFVHGGIPELGGHEHEDKGSFIIEAGGREIISDRGNNYHYHGKEAFHLAKWHNLIYPELSYEAHQVRCTDGAFGKFLKYEYKNGILECVMDLYSAWNGLFKKNIRTVISPNPKLYIIHDSVECDCDVTFRANVYGKMNGNVIEYGDIKLYIHTLNYTPYKIVDDIDGVDGRLTPVNLLKLYTKPGELVTIFELSDNESKAVIKNNTLKYDDLTVEFKDGKVNIT